MFKVRISSLTVVPWRHHLVMILWLNSQQNRFCDASKRMRPLIEVIGASELSRIYMTISHVPATYYIRVGLQWKVGDLYTGFTKCDTSDRESLWRTETRRTILGRHFHSCHFLLSNYYTWPQISAHMPQSPCCVGSRNSSHGLLSPRLFITDQMWPLKPTR